jgi:hypothetical protein
MNNGARQQKVFENKKTKKHIKAFYKIMGDMDEVAKGLLSTHSEVEFTEENINEYVNPIYGRDLDSMEKFLVLGKLHYGKENN